jgi:rhomboid protease GluP
VHLLTLLLTRDVSGALEAAGEDRFCWVIDEAGRRLVIPPEAVENFYGLRQDLESVLAPPHYTSRYMEEPLEYEAGGKLCIRHIGQRPIVNHGLLILNLMGYILCIMFSVAIYNWGDLRWTRVVGEGEWYRLFSHLFLHADATHLTGNLLMLLLIGDITERAVGHLKYLILYVSGGLFAAGVSMYVSYLKGSDIGSIGASGAIFSMVGLLLWVILRNSGKLEMLTTKKMIFLIAYTLYFGFTSTGVDNAAHVGGLIGGFLGGILFYRKRKKGHKGEKT